MAPLSTPARGATIGLIVVFLLLSVFSVAVSVTNANAAARALRAATESALFERASKALLVQEESAETVVDDDTPETRHDYATAHAATRAALQGLTHIAPTSYGPDEVDRLQDLHAQYGVAVLAMFAVAQTDVDLAEPYEEKYVDPFFDPLAAELDEEVHAMYGSASASLASIARSQNFLKFVTPSVFGVALVLLTMFMVQLARSRRRVVAQAEENRYQSLHDALTGLPNRTLLHRRATDCLGQSAAAGTRTALMLLDLDRFKEINDTLGHHYGDLVLQAVTERLRTSVRSTDLVSRLGGDEFAILLPHVDGTAGALAVAAQVQEALRTSLPVAGAPTKVDISIGIAISGLHGDDTESLLQHADMAMYRAKEHGLGVAVHGDAEGGLGRTPPTGRSASRRAPIAQGAVPQR